MTFVPVHNHSEYSALDGLATCKEIAERAVELGCPCCGLTDHGTVAGHLEFGRVMAEYNLKPIYGCEFYHGLKTVFGKQERDQSHFVAGAMTDEGLRNIWRLVDAASTNFRFVGRVNFDFLEKYSEGVFATSACIQGTVAKGILERAEIDPYDMLNRYLDIYGDRFFIEIHTYPGEDHEILNHGLVQIAQERGVGLIYATDAHFASPEQYEIHDAYVAMQTGENVFLDPQDRKMWHPKSLYIQSEEEIRESLSYLSEDVIDEALRNSADLAERCNAELPEVKRHLPAFVPKECPWIKPEEAPVNAGTLLLDLVETGLVERYGGTEEEIREEVWERAKQELGVFLDAGLEHYFLQAWDFCQFCDQNGIKRGPGRGSSAGSIVAYALGITDIDPLHYELIFERFYNPGREKGFPDIDNDFPKKQRKKVRQYLMDRWGHNRVRTIGTITRMKPLAAIDKTHRACGITYEEKDALKDLVDQVPDINILGADSIGWTEKLDPGKTIYVMHSTPQAEHDVGARIMKWVSEQSSERIPFIEYWLEIVGYACSRVSGYGVHPSGVVVSDVDLQDQLPCMWNSKQEVQVTCFPMNDVDERLFVKQDLLGLRNLDVLELWEDLVGETVEWHGLDKREHPEEMWERLDQGFSLGIFQIEDGYARKLCKEFQPRSVEDIAIIISLNRPGPIRSGAPDSFMTRRRGGEDDKFDGRKIPVLKDILEPTYGWFLYQEQVIAFFNSIGYDLSESDAVRKILGKKKPEAMKALYEGLDEWQIDSGKGWITIQPIDAEGVPIGEETKITDKGYMTMAQLHGLGEKLAQEIWNILEEFAKYSFNKSHAIAYAVLGLRTLYAKYIDRQNFVIACICTINESQIQDKMQKVGALVSEARRMGIRVSAPDISRSDVDIARIGDDVLFGFSNIKGIGKGSARFLIQLRERYELLTPEAIYEAIEELQVVWEAERDEAKEAGQPFRKKSPRQSFPSNRIPLLYNAGAFDMTETRQITLTEKQKAEKELLGVIISDDCEEIFKCNLEAIENCDAYADIENGNSGGRLYLPGVITSLVPKKTKREGKAMGIVTIEYQGEEIEFVVFPKQWASHKKLMKERTPGIFTLRKNERGVNLETAIKLRKE